MAIPDEVDIIVCGGELERFHSPKLLTAAFLTLMFLQVVLADV